MCKLVRLCILSLLVGIGSAWGQTGKIDSITPQCHSVPSADGCNSCTECDGVVTSCTLAYCMKSSILLAPQGTIPDPGKIVMGDCEQTVVFRGKSKQIKEIFSDECGGVVFQGSTNIKLPPDLPVTRSACIDIKTGEPCELAIQVKAAPVRWSLEDSGFMEGEACDPPEPKGSNLMCWKSSKAWRPDCDDPNTVAIFPQIANPLFYDFDAAHKRGDKFWCLIISDGKPQP